MSNSNQFSSRMGAVLTMIGVAVGLGNVWRFPYMMGNYGGSAFLFIYLAFTITMAFPALLTEMLLGKKNPKGTILAYQSLFGPQVGKFFGYLFATAVTIAGTYYAVIVGNVLFSALFSVVYGFSEANNPRYQSMLGDSDFQYLFAVIFIVAALFVAYKGLKKGIERVSKIIMPFFIFTILYLIVYAWTLPGALQEVKQFLSPDFQSIGATEVFAALGQAFYSVGLGGTFIVVYASYLSHEKEIPKIALFTCLGDLGASFLVSLFLVPALLILGLQMNVGPSLIFKTLPEFFAILPGGRWIGALFLLSLSLVAFLSLVGAYQVPISSLSHLKIPRKRLFLLFGLFQLIFALPSALYPQIIGILDLIFGSGMQVLGSMMAMMGMWWGAQQLLYRKTLFTNPNSRFANFSVIWLRWIVPGTLLAVLIGYIYSNIF